MTLRFASKISIAYHTSSVPATFSLPAGEYTISSTFASTDPSHQHDGDPPDWSSPLLWKLRAELEMIVTVMDRWYRLLYISQSAGQSCAGVQVCYLELDPYHWLSTNVSVTGRPAGVLVSWAFVC